MRILNAALLLVLYGFFLHGFWRNGRVPTFLWFEASREKEPGTYWTFFGLFGGALIFGLGYFARTIMFPATNKYLYRQDPLSTSEWILSGTLALGICLCGYAVLRNSFRKYLIAQIKHTTDSHVPDDEDHISIAGGLYTLRELRLLQAELIKMPKGYRRLVNAMERVERDWPKN
jgi:hypothetical protein